MTDNNPEKKPKNSWIDAIIITGIVIVSMSLLIMLPKAPYPWKAILIADLVILLFLIILSAKKTEDEYKIIERNNTILEWTEPRKAWHITEKQCFSPVSLALIFVIGFILFFLGLSVAMKLKPPVNPGKNTLTFAQLPMFCAIASACCTAFYASVWWWKKLKVKFSIYGIAREEFSFWKYDRIKSYHFETLSSDNNVYTLIVLCNQKGKVRKIALDDTVDKAKIEEILNSHGIIKLEKVL
jgi:hypothetical protein